MCYSSQWECIGLSPQCAGRVLQLTVGVYWSEPSVLGACVTAHSGSVLVCALSAVGVCCSSQWECIGLSPQCSGRVLQLTVGVYWSEPSVLWACVTAHSGSVLV